MNKKTLAQIALSFVLIAGLTACHGDKESTTTSTDANGTTTQSTTKSNGDASSTTTVTKSPVPDAMATTAP